ncbi:MAG: Riboflavin biosynthesis protein [Alphaproteobacteria bacterium MarineAlpha5_Bin9]|nr:MAG: Riboflavin biosynthesis protein [Alphaproteobacteria bacterium MarineAlpha5_Bin9]
MNKKSLKLIETCKLPTKYGNFKLYAFKEKKTKKEHLAIVLGVLKNKSPSLIRLHSQCLSGESFFSLRCDCRFQLTESLKKIKKNKSGAIIYLQQEGRDIGLLNKIKAYKLQDQGLDTVEANHKLGFDKDPRNYKIATEIIKFFGIKKINLITNNPKKINAIKLTGIKINKRIPIKSNTNNHNKDYLRTKEKKLGHLL